MRKNQRLSGQPVADRGDDPRGRSSSIESHGLRSQFGKSFLGKHSPRLRTTTRWKMKRPGPGPDSPPRKTSGQRATGLTNGLFYRERVEVTGRFRRNLDSDAGLGFDDNLGGLFLLGDPRRGRSTLPMPGPEAVPMVVVVEHEVNIRIARTKLTTDKEQSFRVHDSLPFS